MEQASAVPKIANSTARSTSTEKAGFCLVAVSERDNEYALLSRGLGGVVGLTLPMAPVVRVPYTIYRVATLDKSLTSHCL